MNIEKGNVKEMNIEKGNVKEMSIKKVRSMSVT